MTPATFDAGLPLTGPASVWDGRREARLRPEHAHRYPGLHAGQWESAADRRPRREDR